MLQERHLLRGTRWTRIETRPFTSASGTGEDRQQGNDGPTDTHHGGTETRSWSGINGRALSGPIQSLRTKAVITSPSLEPSTAGTLSTSRPGPSCCIHIGQEKFSPDSACVSVAPETLLAWVMV